MIARCAPKLSEKEVETMAKRTRGMREDDIQYFVKGYQKTGRLPKRPEHPTDTCDPYTGNWVEHLMDSSRLKDVLSEAGFKSEILSGAYGCHKNIFKKILGVFLNMFIRVLGANGIRVAPFFTLYGEKI